MQRGIKKVTFADLKTRLEMQRDVLGHIEALAVLDIADARVFVSTLGELVGLNGNGKHPSTRNGGGKSTHYDSIAAVFAENGNTGLTKVQLAEVAGVPTSGVHTAIYASAKKASFVLAANPAGGREKIVKLTPEALAEAKAK